MENGDDRARHPLTIHGVLIWMWISGIDQRDGLFNGFVSVALALANVMQCIVFHLVHSFSMSVITVKKNKKHKITQKFYTNFVCASMRLWAKRLYHFNTNENPIILKRTHCVLLICRFRCMIWLLFFLVAFQFDRRAKRYWLPYQPANVSLFLVFLCMYSTGSIYNGGYHVHNCTQSQAYSDFKWCPWNEYCGVFYFHTKAKCYVPLDVLQYLCTYSTYTNHV